MNSSEIRSLIQEILAEELRGMVGGGDAGAHADTAPKPQVREERVAIASDADLNRFALRMLELAQDGRSVQEIKAGRWVFRLQGGAAGTRPAPAVEQPVGSAPAETLEFDRGLVSERQIGGLSKNARIRAGKRVRFTPLAQDEIRRKGIHVERKST
ncbi:hypothetical protein [Arhodomonas sp. SL1]|uniref:hypothetical protein n=1 Tax=Arhodomonas sp. SL1 TaxID=3425691 RepID=UPI003F881109